MYPLFFMRPGKNDQLRMLGKFSMPLGTNRMHASSNLPNMRTKELGTLVPPLYVSTL